MESKTRASWIAPTAICAALYVVAIIVTAPIPTPWGVGQFRPGVVIPAFFAVISGPYVAAIGAAIGTFVGDFYLTSLGLTNPLLSLIAGVPGNFVGFIILGWLVKRYRSWIGFIWSSFIGIAVGNLVAASGVVAYFTTLVGGNLWAEWPLDVKMATIFGLTLFWMATMLPFVIPIVPALVRGVSAFRGRLGRSIDLPIWGDTNFFKLILSSLFIAVILGFIFIGVMFTPIGEIMFSRIVSPEIAFWVKILTLIASISVLVFGPLIPLIAGSDARTKSIKR